MNAIDRTKKPKKGRPPVESEAVNLRLVKPLVDALDDYRRSESDVPNRQESIRRLLAEALKEKGHLKP